MSSLRQLAARLGLSHATISAALRNKPGVKPTTRERVLRAAAETGYRPNPLASALMGEMRRSRGQAFRGTLAVLVRSGGVVDGSRPDFSPTLVAGIRQRARELGFLIDEIALGHAGWEPERVTPGLMARGIGGLLLLEPEDHYAGMGIDWSCFSVLSVGSSLGANRFDAICPDYSGAMFTALRHARRLGYARPGLVLAAENRDGVRAAWMAAYCADWFANDAMRGPPPPRPLILSSSDGEATFVGWRSLGAHDVVLSDSIRPWHWMNELGLAGAGGVGFCALGIDSEGAGLCGLDLRLTDAGAKAVELLVEQVLRNEPGPKNTSVVTSVSSSWISGVGMRCESDAVAV